MVELMLIDEIEEPFRLNGTSLRLYDYMSEVSWYFVGQAVEKVNTIESKV